MVRPILIWPVARWREGGPGPTRTIPSLHRRQRLGHLAVIILTTLGFGVAAGDRLFLYGPGALSVIDAVIAPAVPIARWPDGAGAWSYPANPTPGSSNSFVFHRDVVINEIINHGPTLPAVPANYATNVVITITNLWKYSDQGLDLGAAWSAFNYDDSVWPSAAALFNCTTDVLPASKNTPMPLDTSGGVPIVTYYFRTPFTFPGQTNAAQLSLNPIMDAGAVYYLNGVEIYRQNMPGGVIHYTNLASSGVAIPAYSGPFTVSVTNLLAGTNLFAAEVHPFSTNAQLGLPHGLRRGSQPPGPIQPRSARPGIDRSLGGIVQPR